MSTEVRWCFEDEPLDEVMKKMAGTQIRRVPVIDKDDRLVGIVSLGDIATKSGDIAKAAPGCVDNTMLKSLVAPK